MRPPRDDGHVALDKAFSRALDKVKELLAALSVARCCRQVIKEDSAQTARFASVLDPEVVVAPLFETLVLLWRVTLFGD